MGKFAAELKNQIENLKSLSLGARNIPVSIGNFKYAVPRHVDETPCSTIFDVNVNICGGSKTFQILFDRDNPTFCPDVILDPDEDNFFPDIASLKSFAQWNIHSGNALRDLIMDLYVAYSSHQRSVLLNYPQLRDQMKELMSDPRNGSICEVDILKNGPGTFNDTVKILVPINIDYSILPPYVKMKSPGKDACRLCISYESPNLTKITPSLELSPGVQNAFSRVVNLRIPSYGKSSLLEYVNKIHALIENTVNEISNAYKRRESFIFYLLSDIAECVLEFDAITFYEATFLLEINGFYFILFVILSPKFPTERPSLFLQSIYSMDSSADIFRMSVQGFPYHSQWENDAMFYHMKKVIFDNIEDFQEKSLPSS